MRYRVLRSVAHNFAHSFTSAMNWCEGDFTMSWLAREMVRRELPRFELDLLSGMANPPELVVPEIRDAIASYVEWFPRLLRSQEMDPARVRRAAIVLTFALERRAEGVGRFAGLWSMPGECIVTIEDDRGRIHVGRERGGWGSHDSGTVDPARRLVIDRRRLHGADLTGRDVDSFCAIASRFDGCSFRGVSYDDAVWGEGRREADVGFRTGIDLGLQQLPAGPDYLFVPDAALAVKTGRAAIAAWPADETRRLAAVLLDIMETDLAGGQRQQFYRVPERGHLATPWDRLRVALANGASPTP